MTYKEKILPSILAAFAFSFTFLLFGPLEIYVSNIEELGFMMNHFIVPMLFISLGVFAVIFAILFFLPDKAHKIGYIIVFAISVIGYIQGNFMNQGINSLMGDDVGSPIKTYVYILNTVIWVILIAAVVVGAIMSKKYKWIKTVSIFMLVLIIGMQLAGCAAVIVDYTNKTEKPDDVTDIQTSTDSSTQTDVSTENDNTETPEPGSYVMTTKGLYEVSSGKNVIVFVIDRFDISFYEDILDQNPEFFDKFEDFQIYTDNLSTYSRTYPGITSMLTGIDFTGDLNAEQYFRHAYSDSSFLKDLKKNNYRIKIYTQSYYAFRSPSALAGIAYNMERTDKVAEVNNKAGLASSMLLLSAYRYLPVVAKGLVNVSSGTFSGYLSYEDTYPIFDSDDNVAVYQGLKENGLSLDDSENSFIFIHVIGCHDPYKMNEKGEYEEGVSSTRTAMGCMNMVYDYVCELKRLGVYDDSMIVVTGDHPRARDDAAYPSQARITSLLVKNPGKTECTPFSENETPVSQDMLIPSIIKEMNIKTENSYGMSYSEAENSTGYIRRHIFELYTKDGTILVEYNVEGSGKDFSKWYIKSEKNIGGLYK